MRFSKTKQIVAMTLLTVLPFHKVFAGPPYQTDDPEPVGAGEHEVYVAFERTRTNEGTSGTAPLVELNYSPTDNLQLGVAIPYAFDKSRGAHEHRGFGDVGFNAKFRFLDESDTHPMMSFFPTIVAPTGNADDNLGNGKPQLFLPLWLQKNWGDWQSNAGGGYWINHAAGARNHWFFGWQVQKQFTEHWNLGAEVFYSTEEAAGEGSSSGANIGLVYTVDPHNHLLFSVGRGLSNVSLNQMSSYIGYQLSW